MKLLKLIIVIIIVLLVVFYFAANIFLVTKGKVLLSKNLEKIVGKDVKIDSLYLTLPYVISINGLKIDDIISINKLSIEPSILGLFMAKAGLNKLVIKSAEISIIRTDDFKFNFSPILENIMRNQPKGKAAISFIKEVFINNAKLSFYDKVTNLTFYIMPIDFSATTSLLDLKTGVKADAKVISEQKNELGNIKIEGWLNFLKKDMDAEFSLEDLQPAYFSPLFENFTRKVASGKLLFTADMVSKNNNLAINCHLETRDLRFKDEALIFDTEQEKVTLLSNLSGLVLDTLFGPGSGGIFDFSIHTKFDHPRLEGLQFKGNIFKEPIKKIIEKGPQEAIEEIKKVGEDFEKIGKELKEQFKDIADIFKGKIKESENSESGDSSSNSAPSQ